MITEIPLEKRLLIEASAGTGKTYTLTKIIIRLLIEKNYQPEQIIATTFTKKAAQEMQVRIMQDFDLIKNNIINLLKEINQNYKEFNQIINDFIKKSNDEIINKFLKKIEFNQLIDFAKKIINIEQNIDKLFIGTLDSLFNRWLKEFSFIEQKETLIEEKDNIGPLITNIFRKKSQELIDNDPDLLNYLDFPKENIIEEITKTLNYGEIILDPINKPIATDLNNDLDKYLNNINQNDLNDYFDFLNSIEFKNSLNKNHHKKIAENGFNDLNGLFKCLLSNNYDEFNNHKENEIFTKLYEEPTFKKNNQKIENKFNNNPIRTEIKKILEFYRKKQEYKKEIEQYLYYQCFIETKKQLNDFLTKNNQTSYSNKTNLLLDLINNEDIAKQIQQNYPVLLVDESQDLNKNQTQILTKIYLDNPIDNGFFLLVGDPKQAIYRFRGSDVTNYNYLKKNYFNQNQIHTLNKNYRSTDKLIDGLNQLYLQNEKTKKISKNIEYHKINAEKKAKEKNTKSIQWFFLDKDKDKEIKTVINIVNDLVSQNYKYEDILILARTNKKLIELQKELIKKDIPTNYQADNSLFNNPVAFELNYLLQAINSPNNIDKQNRLLVGKFFQLNQDELINWNKNNSTKKFTELLQSAQKYFYSNLALTGINQVLASKLVNDCNSWQKIARQPAYLAEQDLLDLRRLLQILHKEAKNKNLSLLINWWQAQLAQPPKADWAKADSLSKNNGLRLLTIHKAKGLQAKVVLLINLTNRANNLAIFANYTDENDQAHLTVEVEKYKENIDQEKKEENNRLLYVALTRAEEKLIIFTKQKEGNNFFNNLNIKNDTISKLDNHSICVIDNKETTKTNQKANHNKKELPKTTIFPLPKKQNFYGWHKASFSSLTKKNNTNKINDIPLIIDLEISKNENLTNENLPLPLRFAYGKDAGNFLHKSLEKLDPHNQNNWQYLLVNFAQEFNIESQDIIDNYQEYLDWFNQIYNSKLISGISLNQIKNKMHELDFMVSSNNFDVNKINNLFNKYNYPAFINADKKIYRFLQGKIDLIYLHNNKYYVVDYKSNYLTEYNQENINQVMQEHQYFLQNIIYQLALHRYLKHILPDYEIDKNLGDGEYFFLRAIDDGHFRIETNKKLILELDELLN